MFTIKSYRNNRIGLQNQNPMAFWSLHLKSQGLSEVKDNNIVNNNYLCNVHDFELWKY